MKLRNAPKSSESEFENPILQNRAKRLMMKTGNMFRWTLLGASVATYGNVGNVQLPLDPPVHLKSETEISHDESRKRAVTG